MPRKPTNYANTLIYKIVCKDLNIKDIYVGHTTSYKDRKREHKSRCNNLYQFPLYITINNNGGWNNWEMIEVEKFPCCDANEARCRERFWFEELNAKLNAKSPTLDEDKLKKYRQTYLQQYRKTLTDLQIINKLEYDKIWKSQKYTCVCGAEILNGCKTKHFRTKKHTTFLKEM